MKARVLSLRAILAGVTILVTTLSALVAGSLVLLTGILHRTTDDATTSVQSVRLAEEAEIDLLLHERALDHIVRSNIETELRQRLVEARRFTTTPHEARVLDEAEARVDAYLASARNANVMTGAVIAQQAAAYDALEALVAVNVADSNEARIRAGRWNQVANGLGIGAGALLFLFAGGVLVVLRRASAPVLSLGAAMERFAKGDHEARVRESGPAELREIIRRFNEMAAALSARRRAQMAFLGGVAHDLRNPLSVLKLAVASLPPDRPLPSEQRLRQIVEKIERQMTRLERMVSDILDTARIEAGELDLRVEIADIRALVMEVVRLFDGTSDHRLEVSLPEHELLVRCDHLRIEQVVTNLISNAIKYSPAGSRIETRVESRNDEVVLSVTDHGLGISEDDQQRVFEPFRRVGLSKAAVPGIGLGLFVVRQIVEAHGGSIEVESTVGKGSTFRVRLPR